MRTIKTLLFFLSYFMLNGATYGQLISQKPTDQSNENPTSVVNTQYISPGYNFVISYTDNIAENITAWVEAGNMNAVKFNSYTSYPIVVYGAQIYVGNGSFPIGGSILNQPFRLSVYDSDGDNGLPGTLMDSVSAVVANYEWLTITGLDALVTRDFYIAITQLSNEPNCIPIGVDETLPKAYRSYSRFITNGETWQLSPYQDFMINAMVSTNVGLDKPDASVIKISPNPANETVKLDFPSNIKSITIYSVSGQVVFEKIAANLSDISIPTSSYLSGVYYIRFTTSNGDSLIRKLVVVH